MNYISEAITPVFEPNQGMIKRANEFLTTYNNDIPTLLAKLDILCGCTFLDSAKLYYRAPTAAESKEISFAFVTKGDSIPDNMALETLVGSTAMPTDPAKKFYSCTSLDDTSPTPIASSSDTLSGKEEARKQCNDWAFLKSFTSVNSKITTDTNADNVYVSISSTGGCFNIAGDLRTLPVLALTTTSVKDAIASLEVVCTDSSCATVALDTEFGYDSYTIPSLPVTCSSNVCTTEPITVTTNAYRYGIYIPALTVGFTDISAGSLFSLCMYEIDN